MGTRKSTVVPRAGFHQRREGSMEPRRFAACPLPLREFPQPLPFEITPLSPWRQKAQAGQHRGILWGESSLVPPISKPHGPFFCCTRATM